MHAKNVSNKCKRSRITSEPAAIKGRSGLRYCTALCIALKVNTGFNIPRPFIAAPWRCEYTWKF